jgi:LacI family transcriptional regulator
MTVREIAKLAGVSIGTVDRVLHGRGEVSPETAKKVKAIIDTHHFTPNPIARRLKRNRAYRFCALVPRRDQDSGYWEQIIQGIQAGVYEVETMGIETEIIEFNHYDPGDFKKVSQKTLRKAPDGVIFPPYEPKIAKSFTEDLDNMRIPYVFFDSDLPGANPICTIGQDSFQGGYLAGNLLHLFIGTITGFVAVFYAPLSYHIGRRRDGFLQYASEKGINATVKNYKDRNLEILSSREIEKYLLKQQSLQGVFVSYADVHLFAQAAEARRKRGDFFIVGYDLVPANHKLLKEGQIDAIISQRPHEQGRLALLSLYRHIVLGYEIDSTVKMPLDIYVQANVPEINGTGSINLPGNDIRLNERSGAGSL